MLKFISDYTKHVKLDVNVKPLLEVFSFHMFSAMVKTSNRHYKYSRAFLRPSGISEFTTGSKFHFS